MDDTTYEDLYWESDIFDLPNRLANDPAKDSDDVMDSELSDNEEPSDPIHWSNTCALKDKLTADAVLPAVKNTLSYMCSQGLNLPLFLHVLSWGNESCIPDEQVQYARTSLMVSEKLPGILQRWYCSPRSLHKGKMAAGAHVCLQKFGARCVKDVVEQEMKVMADRSHYNNRKREPAKQRMC
jgi:hypothetical protein